MLGTYHYHEIIRKTIIAFGTLFNTVEIRHKKQDGSNYSSMKVPIAYGPAEKFLARLEQKPDLRKRVAITLPRLVFELISIRYDNSRKVSAMQTFKAFTKDGSKLAKKVFMPVPYNLGFRLSIMTQYNEDSMQIIEQILPIFQPSFNVTVDLVDSIGEKRDIPMVLDNISFDDNYESGFEEKRVIIHSLDFTAKKLICSDQLQIVVKVLLKKLLSIIKLELILKIHQENLDTLLNQEQLKITTMTPQLLYRKILMKK